ncbi:MAG TPA: chromate resistance protein ChrB domain-containing protein [Thermoanaerobaculia bacterium]|nr:chromate resistance protein ChrB domain-containing protein [Thermoanaerobaculia bacterium]
MKWVTRKSIHVNRTATAWLIRRFIDPGAEIAFVEPSDVAGIQERESAIGFDAPGARYPHKDDKGRCSFEQLVDEHFPDDRPLKQLALVVHGADFPKEIAITPESAGLWAISQGFGDDVAKDDAEIVERASFIYDALLVHMRRVSDRSSV